MNEVNGVHTMFIKNLVLNACSKVAWNIWWEVTVRLKPRRWISSEILKLTIMHLDQKIFTSEKSLCLLIVEHYILNLFSCITLPIVLTTYLIYIHWPLWVGFPSCLRRSVKETCPAISEQLKITISGFFNNRNHALKSNTFPRLSCSHLPPQWTTLSVSARNTHRL